MGNQFTCVSCLNREDEELCAKPMSPVGARAQGGESGEQSNTKCMPREAEGQGEARSEKDELQAHINAIVEARKRSKASPAPKPTGEHELRNKIKAIQEGNELRDQINAIVGAHAKSLKEQRVTLAETTYLPSPSPAKSLSDEEVGYWANAALSEAKARSTPGKSPPPPLYLPWVSGVAGLSSTQPQLNSWVAGEDDFAPCQLNFAEYEHFQEGSEFASSAATNTTKDSANAPSSVDVPEPAFSCSAEKKKEETVADSKVQASSFKVTDIPSPTRNRAKKLWAMMEKAAAEVEKSEEASPEKTAAPKEYLDDVHREYLEKKLAERAAEWASSQAEEDEEEPSLKHLSFAEQEEDEEQARLREIEFFKEYEEKAQMAEMDKMVVDAFLESVKKCAWRDRQVRTPIKGSNLYVRHMRPCRPAGTSVDVKDSNFRNLGTFLQFLEAEGLLRLKPGLTDPVVSEIYFDACRQYTYVPQFNPSSATPNRGHPVGCCCRFCPTPNRTANVVPAVPTVEMQYQ